MSLPATTNDKVFEGVMEFLHNEGDILLKRRKDILSAFKNIETSVLGKNTSENIAKARNDLITRAEHRTELDLTSYNISSLDIGAFQKDAVVVTEALSYTLEVLIRIVEKLQNSGIIQHVKIENTTPGAVVVDQGQSKGLFGRLREVLFGQESPQDQQFQKVVALLETKLREVQGANERWRTWKMQRIKFLNVAVLYSKDGKDFNHMYAFLLTEIMDFYDMQERVLPVLSAGLRVHEMDMRKIFAQLSNWMSQQQTQQQQQQAMWQNIGAGMGNSLRPQSYMPGNGSATPPQA